MTGDELHNADPEPLTFNAMNDGPIPEAPPGLETLPMPKGIYLRFQPFVVRPADYGQSLVDGECSECGAKPSRDETLQLEATTQGMALIHQCRTCSLQTILVVANCQRPSPFPMNGKDWLDVR